MVERHLAKVNVARSNRVTRFLNVRAATPVELLCYWEARGKALNAYLNPIPAETQDSLIMPSPSIFSLRPRQ